MTENSSSNRTVQNWEVLAKLNQGKWNPYAYDVKTREFVEMKNLELKRLRASVVRREKTFRIVFTKEDYMFVIPDEDWSSLENYVFPDKERSE
jgi:hypothetical protein